MPSQTNPVTITDEQARCIERWRKLDHDARSQALVLIDAEIGDLFYKSGPGDPAQPMRRGLTLALDVLRSLLKEADRG